MGIIVICLIIAMIAWGIGIFAWLQARAHRKHEQEYRTRERSDLADQSRDAADGLGVIAKIAFSAGLVVPLAVLVVASFTIIGTSRVGVVTTFGKPHPEVLHEGPHFVLPVSSVHEVFTGLDTAAANKMSAASKDMQAVGGSVTVNYAVDPARARDLYILNPTLLYRQSFIEPALFETFKAVTSRYTAEELITKRAAVSAEFIEALKIKLAQFHVRVQNVNITDFGFSKAFDEAIEAKVTATQRAETAKNDLERIKFEAQQTIERAKAGAETIRIQAEAINKQGGQAYVDMKAVEKWDGKLPQYMMGGNNATPFIQIK
jgi:regulator of protease activity HflC (stomatin/prohibitin superfamily)